MNWTSEQCKARILSELASTNGDTAAMTLWYRVHEWFDQHDALENVPLWTRLVNEWDILHGEMK